MSDTGRMAARRHRLFLVFAAAWDVAVGVLLLVLPEGRGGIGSVTPTSRVRMVGAIIIAWGALYAALAWRPVRALLIVSAIAKCVGGANGLLGLLRGNRDAVTAVSLADAGWVPGFVLAARDIRR